MANAKSSMKSLLDTRKLRKALSKPSTTKAIAIAGGVAAALGLGYLVLRPKTAKAKSVVNDPAIPDKEWESEIRSLAAPLAAASNWPGLADFLVVAAYTESRGVKTAHSSNSRNAARGWFGIRPDTGLVGPLEGLPGDMLYDPRVAVIAAANLAWHLGDPEWRGSRARSEVPWGAIRRGWARPGLVKDYGWAQERSKDVLGRMVKSEKATGLVGLHDVLAFPAGSEWIGIAEASALLGFKP